MPTFQCPSCGQAMQAADEHAGLQTQCPRCGQAVTIPPPAPAASFAPPPMPFGGPLPKARTSGLAVAALILCVIPFTFPIGIILAVVALVTLRNRPDRSGSGLAIVGLVVGGAMIPFIALLISILLPSLGSAREAARRTKCLANLRGFGNTFRIYACSYDGHYPAIARGRTIDGERTADPDSLDTDASLWLMVQAGIASPDVFICPSDGGAKRFGGNPDSSGPFPLVDATGLPGPGATFRSLSYSYQVPQGYGGNPSRDNPNATRFAIMADRAPPAGQLALVPAADAANVGTAQAWLDGLEDTGGSPAQPSKDMVNSPNHRGEGQNVLFQDGHAQWVSHPFCGIGGDNIYTCQSAGGQPRGKFSFDEPVGPEGIRGAPPAARSTSDAPCPRNDDDSVLCNIREGQLVGGP